MNNLRSVCRDVSIALVSILFGFALVWAGSTNTIDVFVTILILMVPMVSLFLVARHWPKPDLDN